MGRPYINDTHGKGTCNREPMVPFAVITHDIIIWPTTIAGSACRQDNPTAIIDAASSYEATLNASDILNNERLSTRLPILLGSELALPISNPSPVCPSSVCLRY